MHAASSNSDISGIARPAQLALFDSSSGETILSAFMV
jgi:hypothetical protein